MYTNVLVLKIYFNLSLPIFTHTQAYLKFLNSLLGLRLWVVQLSATRCYSIYCCFLIQSEWVLHPQLSMLPCLLRGVNSKHAKFLGSRLPWHQESYSWHLVFQKWLQGNVFILTGEVWAKITHAFLVMRLCHISNTSILDWQKKILPIPGCFYKCHAFSFTYEIRSVLVCYF